MVKEGLRVVDTLQELRWVRGAVAVSAVLVTSLVVGFAPPAGAQIQLQHQQTIQIPAAAAVFEADGLTFDATSGNLYVSDGSTAFSVITPAGGFVENVTFGTGVPNADGLQILPNGNLLTAENLEVVEIDPATGDAVNGGISLDLTGVVIDDVEGVTFDPSANTIWTVGLFLSEVSTAGARLDEFSLGDDDVVDPKGVAYDPDSGLLLIVENDFNTLSFFDQMGNLVDQFDLSQTPGFPDPTANLNAVTLDPQSDTVYVGSRSSIGVFSVPEPSADLAEAACLAALVGVGWARRRAGRAAKPAV